MAEPKDVVVAVDLGGTALKGALVDRSTDIVYQETQPTPHDGTDHIVDSIADCFGHLHAEGQRIGASVVGAGLVVPGIVDDEAEMAVFSANLGWKNLALPEMVRPRIGLPLAFGHDVRAACMAEVAAGAAQGIRNAIFVPIGTGISAAVVLDGKLVRDPAVGEIGHVVVEPAGARCGCGGRGCLETVASTPAISRRYTEQTGRVAKGAAEVVQMVVAGQPEASAVWDEAIKSLASVIAPAAAITGAEMIVVGGGLARAGPVLVKPLQAAIQSRLPMQSGLRVVSAKFGEWAGCVGAAMLAWTSER